jgi:hypothetical protein
VELAATMHMERITACVAAMRTEWAHARPEDADHALAACLTDYVDEAVHDAVDNKLREHHATILNMIEGTVNDAVHEILPTLVASQMHVALPILASTAAQIALKQPIAESLSSTVATATVPITQVSKLGVADAIVRVAAEAASKVTIGGWQNDGSFKSCVVCGAKAQIWCYGCHALLYCSHTCRHEDWPKHRVTHKPREHAALVAKKF